MYERGVMLPYHAAVNAGLRVRMRREHAAVRRRRKHAAQSSSLHQVPLPSISPPRNVFLPLLLFLHTISQHHHPSCTISLLPEEVRDDLSPSSYSPMSFVASKFITYDPFSSYPFSFVFLWFQRKIQYCSWRLLHPVLAILSCGFISPEALQFIVWVSISASILFLSSS